MVTITPLKTIYLIRHAESQENIMYNAGRRVLASLKGFKKPDRSDISRTASIPTNFMKQSVTDADLSDVGEQQTKKLKEYLTSSQILSSGSGGVVVHSPLKRAQRTAREMIPPSSAEENALSDNNPRGRLEFLELDCLIEINPREQMRYGRKRLDERISLFETWLCNACAETREGDIVIVGHSQYFARMLKVPPKTFGNCDVWEMEYGGEEEENGGSGGKGGGLPRLWRGMKLLFRYEADDESERETIQQNDPVNNESGEE